MKKRIAFLDYWRAAAIIGMVIYHVFYMLGFYDVYSVDLGRGVLFFVGHFARWSFLILVGVSLALSSRNQIWRGAQLLLVAMGVSAVTYLFVGDLYVRFGILHLIALGIICGSFFRARRNLALFVAGGIWAVSFLFTFPDEMKSIDFFPVFPWLALIFLGIYLGKLKWPFVGRMAWIEFLSKNSLKIYLIHVPIIWGLIMLMR